MAERLDSRRLHNRLRELIDRSPSALGTFITLADSTSVDLAALAGFQFVVIECEHSALNLETVREVERSPKEAGDGAEVDQLLEPGPPHPLWVVVDLKSIAGDSLTAAFAIRLRRG